MDEKFIQGINIAVCELSGCQGKVINNSNLSSALGTLQWFDNEEEKAAALFRSLILNHPFQDGNKRTACLVLFRMKVPSINDEKLESLAIEVAMGKIKDPVEIADILYDRK